MKTIDILLNAARTSEKRSMLQYRVHGLIEKAFCIGRIDWNQFCMLSRILHQREAYRID